MQVEGCWDKEFRSPGFPRVCSGGDRSPTLFMRVWAVEGTPGYVTGNHTSALHGSLPQPGKEPHGLRGSLGVSPPIPSPQSRSHQKTGSPSPLPATWSDSMGQAEGSHHAVPRAALLGAGFHTHRVGEKADGQAKCPAQGCQQLPSPTSIISRKPLNHLVGEKHGIREVR